MPMRLFLFSLVIFLSSLAPASVWTATNSWNESWEIRYSEWVQSAIQKNYFVSGPYGAIATDCSDLVYATHLIFSFENKLPFSISSGLSEKTSQFDGISSGQSRFISFMNFTLEATSTSSLSNDTYPVAIRRDVFRAGIIFLQRRSNSGHVELIKDVRENGVIELAGSTLPKKVRALVITTSLTVMPADSQSGFRAWIQPEQRGRSQSSLPGYSLEQYQGTQPATSDQLKAWTANLHRKLAIKQEPVSEAITRQLGDLCTLAEARVEVVIDAYNFKNRVQRCLTAEEFDAYSTPGKDKRLLRTLEQVLTLKHPDQKKLSTEMINGLSEELAVCGTLNYFPGRHISVIDFLTRLAKKQVASDPNETLDERWGVITPNGHRCPVY